MKHLFKTVRFGKESFFSTPWHSYHAVSSFASRGMEFYNLMVALSIAYIGFNYLKPVADAFIGGWYISQAGRVISFLLILLLIRAPKSTVFLRRYLPFGLALVTIWSITVLVNMMFSHFDSGEYFLLSLYEILTTTAIYLVFAYITENYPSSSRKFIIAFAIFASINTAVGLYGAVTGQSLLESSDFDAGFGAFGFDPRTGRAAGFRGENYVGLWCAPLLSLALFSLFRTGYKILALVGLPFLLASIVSSLSRTSALSSLVVLVVWLLMALRSGRSLKLIIVIVLLLTSSLYVSQKVITQQMGFIHRNVIESQVNRLRSNIRFEVWLYWLNVAAEHPLGIGPGGIIQTMIFGAIEYVPHNSFLDVMVEYGIPGLVLYCIPWVIAFRSTMWLLRQRRPDFESAVWVATLWGMFGSLFLLSNPFMKIVFIVVGCIEGRRRFFMKNLA